MSVAAPKRSTISTCVRAGLPVATTAIDVRCVGWRPIGASMVVARARSPCTTARYSRVTVRACNCRTRSVCASSVLATTMRPLVSLSSRCTMPARGSAASAGAWCSSAFSSVPSQLPLPGCTTSPAGLSSTRIAASSCAIDSAMASGANGVACGSAPSVTAMRFAAAHLRRRLGDRDGVDGHESGLDPALAGGCASAAAATARAPGRAAARRPSAGTVSAWRNGAATRGEAGAMGRL